MDSLLLLIKPVKRHCSAGMVILGKQNLLN